MRLQWTDEQIERAEEALLDHVWGQGRTPEQEIRDQILAILATLTPDIEALIAAEVEARMKGLREALEDMVAAAEALARLQSPKWNGEATPGGPLAKARAALATPGDAT